MESLFEQLGGTYTRQGDYCLPDVCLPPEEERPIVIYGQRRRTFLREHHRVLYYNLLTAGVLINGLMQQHRSYDAETNGQIDALVLRLCDIAEAMKPGRKKKIPFEPVEIRLICQCLMEWRNREIQAERHGAVDALNELLIRFTR